VGRCADDFPQLPVRSYVVDVRFFRASTSKGSYSLCVAVQRGAARCGRFTMQKTVLLARRGAVRCGAVQRGATQRGSVWRGAVQRGPRSSPEFERKLPCLDHGNEYLDRLDRSPHSEGSKKRTGGGVLVLMVPVLLVLSPIYFGPCDSLAVV
jgi:hypothetical protein